MSIVMTDHVISEDIGILMCCHGMCSALVEQIWHPNIIYLLKDVCECEFRKPRSMLPWWQKERPQSLAIEVNAKEFSSIFSHNTSLYKIRII